MIRHFVFTVPMCEITAPKIIQDAEVFKSIDIDTKVNNNQIGRASCRERV